MLYGCQLLQLNTERQALPVTESQNNLSAFQQIEFSQDTKYLRFDTAIEFHKNTMRINFLSELGQHIATIFLVGDSLEIETHMPFVDKESLKNIFYAFQYSFWPVNALAGTKPAQTHIKQTLNKRALYRGSRLESYTDYDTRCAWSGELQFFDLKNNYNVRFQTAILNEEHPFTSHEFQCPPN